MEVWGGSVAGPSRPVLHGGCTDVHLDGSSGLLRELTFGCTGKAKLALQVRTSLLAYRTDKSGAASFSCRVNWTEKATAQPTDRPILFPGKVRQPWFAAGWL
jgi:hypothetical protein